MILRICILICLPALCCCYIYRPAGGRWWETWSYSVIWDKYTREGPQPLNSQWESWMEHLLTLHVRNMTLEIMKDVENKMILADKVSLQHQGTKNYDIGFLASGIRDKFKYMVQIYHDYAETKSFMGGRFTVEQYFQANFVLQGLYKELLMERDLYFDTIARHKAMRPTRPKKPKFGDRNTVAYRRQLPLKKPKKALVPNDEGYKKSLRVQKWAEKWNNFDPAKEGIAVDFEDMV